MKQRRLSREEASEVARRKRQAGTTVSADADGDGAFGELREAQRDLADGLGIKMRNWFEEVATERQAQEWEWLRALSEYYGQEGDSDTDEFGVSDEPKELGSRAYIRAMRTKVRTTTARMVDMLFPGGSQRNWRLDVPRNPVLPDEVLRGLVTDHARGELEELAEAAMLAPEDYAAQVESGSMPSLDELAAPFSEGKVHEYLAPGEDEIENLVEQEAQRRCDNMSEEIDDQLLGCDYRTEASRAIFSGNLYGTGWLMGPLTEERSVRRWIPRDGEWKGVSRKEMWPWMQFIPVWDAYPTDVSATGVPRVEGVFRREVLSKPELLRYAGIEWVDEGVLKEYIRSVPNGDAPIRRWWEEVKRGMNVGDEGTLNSSRSRSYELLHYDGFLDPALVADWATAVGNDGLHDELDDEPMRVRMIIVGQTTIGMQLMPFGEGVEIWHRYVFEESEFGIYGEGLAGAFRDPGKMINAGVRSVLDNMGATAVGVVEVNTDLLDPAHTTRIATNGLQGGDVVFRTGRGQEAANQAVRVHQQTSTVGDSMRLIDVGRDMGDEATGMPRYSGGLSDSGVMKTASGFSMALSSANVALKEQVGNFDRGITRPALSALYAWNMEYSPRNDVRGDMKVFPTGSTSLITKEIRVGHIDALAESTRNPIDASWMKRGALNRERVKLRDLDPDMFVLSDEEFNKRQREEAEAVAEANAGAGEPDDMLAVRRAAGGGGDEL